MRAIHIRWWLTLCLLGSCIPSVGSAATPDREAADIQRSMEQAREQLDEAARKLAALHSRMWRLETTGPHADRPMLGVLLDDHDLSAPLVLVGVTPESGAERAGLQAGDELVAVNGKRLDKAGEKNRMRLIGEALSPIPAGDPVTVEFLRNGEPMQAEVVTMARGQYMSKAFEEERPWLESLTALAELEDLEALQGLEELEVLADGKLDLAGNGVLRVPAGLRFEDVEGELAQYFDVDSGVLVLDAPDRAEGLESGDILLAIEGEAVAGADRALERLASLKGQVQARVKRRGRERDVEIDADALNAKQAVHVVRGEQRIRIHQSGNGEGGQDVRVDIRADD